MKRKLTNKKDCPLNQNEVNTKISEYERIINKLSIVEACNKKEIALMKENLIIQKKEIITCKKEIERLNKVIFDIKNSKGYRILEFLRGVIIKIKRLFKIK